MPDEVMKHVWWEWLGEGLTLAEERLESTPHVGLGAVLGAVVVAGLVTRPGVEGWPLWLAASVGLVLALGAWWCAAVVALVALLPSGAGRAWGPAVTLGAGCVLAWCGWPWEVAGWVLVALAGVWGVQRLAEAGRDAEIEQHLR
ncbi:hypothetical protein [Nocardiopsis synnemataformans]|uniref:hypothetical protein n=1 Tax=Nocardiopsis synnemataformans TaxID=61305 RepID=UPI003EB7906E